MHLARRPWIALLVVLAASPASGDDAAREAERFFEAEVRPLLAKNCVKCHGADQQKGGLRLDSRDALLAGGDSGPVVEPGHPEESPLIEAVHYDGLKMPPTGRLDADQVRVLERWVSLGAPWPSDGHAVAGPVRDGTSRGGRIDDEARAWWAFQPLARPEPPAVGDAAWPRNPIDRFILARLEGAGLAPAPEADRRTLIRRLTFDLHGLPPSPEVVEAFVADERPDAYERLVDRLLASPRYGERWARHWLDLVRFAESDGYRQDAFRPEAWRYRDWVIAAFNADMPYDRFVIEQLAGDELAPDDPALRIPTAFLRLWPYEFNQRDVPGQWATILNDLTDVTGDVFLGTGLACARCHDHKFDPILQRDYYRIQAFFTPLLPRDDLPLGPADEVADYHVRNAAWALRTADLREQIAAIERPHRQAAQAEAFAKFQPGLQAILRKPAAERSDAERQLAYLMERQLVEEFGKIDGRIKGDEKKRYDALTKQLAAFDALKPPEPPRAFTATDVSPEPPPTVIPGDRSGTEVEPGYLAVLDERPAVVETPAPGSRTSGRRLTLARWLTRPDHPLTTRVIANRLWQYHFGRGLSATPSDFGHLGEAPSHPELLDWLANELVTHDWRLKDIHRLIVTSAAYRQGLADAIAAAAGHGVDPENRLLWQRAPRRLDAESIRDALLAASGELASFPGGPSVGADTPRRTIFTRQLRNSLDPLLDAFDAPDGSASTPARNQTTTPVQALRLVNGRWALARAERFADRLERECPGDSGGQVERAYGLALGRRPEAGERREALRFLDEQAALARGAACDEAPTPSEAAHAALVDFAHALLLSNGFLYVD
jgi:mono/diheme cytochrome c family protein